MNNKFQKFNKIGGALAFLIIFSILAYISTNYYRVFCITVAVTALLTFINEVKQTKIELISYLVYMASSLCFTIGSYVFYKSYYNNNAVLVAKIGLLIISLLILIASIIGVLISLYLIFNYFKTKKNTN